MEDDELAQIRARRMGGMGGGGVAGGMAGMPSGRAGGNSAEDEEKKAQMEEMRKTMLMSILDGEARERLSRISMVKAEKARAVEDLVIRMAQTGQIRGKVSENQLIDLLGNIADSKQETKITYNRRRFDDDEEEEEWNL
ncbi:hypothetical protein RI367_003756 [Sorochytrium milnesiophthora]